MKKQFVRWLTLFAAGTAFALTEVHPGDNIVQIVNAAQSGDEIVIAASPEPYTVSAQLLVGSGVTLRGATDDFNDVVIRPDPAFATVIKVTGSEAKVANLTLKGLKSAYSRGSGIYAENGAVVTNCRVTASSTSQSRYSYGFAIYNDGAMVTDCTIDGITMSNYTQGMYYQTGASALADRIVITNITSSCGWSYGSGYAAAIAIWQADGEIRNAFVADNRQTAAPSRTYANGIFVQIANGRFVSSSVIDNTSVAAATADAANEYSVPVYAAANAFVTNCLFAGNMVGSFELNAKTKTAQPFACCCSSVVSNFTGSGNVIMDECGYNRVAGAFYSLDPASVCVDAGTNMVWMVDGKDIQGENRLSGLRVDIGAVELQRKSFDVSFAATAYSALGKLETILSATVIGDLTGISYSWDLDGDGVYETAGADKSSVPLSIVTPGQITVSLKVVNGSGAEAADSRAFTVYPEVIWYDSSSTTPIWPYASAVTAASTLDDAFAAAIAGATVLIAAGDHTLSGEMIIPERVVVRGATGNRDDVIVRGNRTERLFSVLGEGTTLADITLTDLPAGAVEGGGVRIERGVVTNCHFTASTTSGTTVKGTTLYGYAVYNYNGKVLNCHIDNLATSGMYVGCGIYQKGASSLTDRCIVEGLTSTWWSNGVSYPCCLGIYVSGGSVRNTLVRNNRINVSGGSNKNYDLGAFIHAGGSATVENCTVIENILPTEKSGSENFTQPVYTSDTAALVNCLVVSNTIAGAQRNWKSTGANLDHCCTTDAAQLAGAGNVEAAGQIYKWRENGQLRMVSNSPCRDAGINLDWSANALDIYGNPRLRSGTVDIGCVEAEGRGMMLRFY